MSIPIGIILLNIFLAIVTPEGKDIIFEFVNEISSFVLIVYFYDVAIILLRKLEDYAEERIMLMLRTSEGINLNEFKNSFYDLYERKKEVIENLIQNKFIYGLPTHIKLTEKGKYVANQIIIKLFNS